MCGVCLWELRNQKKLAKYKSHPSRVSLASHAGVFRGARFSTLPVGRDEKRAPLKTPAWEARVSAAMCGNGRLDYQSLFGK